MPVNTVNTDVRKYRTWKYLFIFILHLRYLRLLLHLLIYGENVSDRNELWWYFCGDN